MSEEQNEPSPAEEHAGGEEEVRIDFSRWIGDGWRLIRDDLLGYAIATLIGVVIVIVLMQALHFLLAAALVGPLQAGYYLMISNHMRTGRPLIGDIFNGFSRFVPTFLASLLIAVGLMIGVAACFVGSIFGLGIWMFTFLFIVDRGYDFWEAMEASRMVAKRDYLEFSLFALVLVVINMAGVLAFGLGVLITLPLAMASVTCAYRDLVGLAPEAAVQPPAPPPVKEPRGAPDRPDPTG